VALAIFAGLYTAAGGLRAVAYTDVLQSIVLLVGSMVLFALVFAEFDYSWAQVTAVVPPEKLSLIRPLDDAALPWLGTLLGLPIMGFYYWTMNQYVCQRLLGARSIEAAGKGALIAAALKLLPLFFMVLPGAMAVGLFTDLDRPDTVFPRLIGAYAPPGLAGLMVAGLLAAIMSSVDSALNSASTLVITDFVQPRRPRLDAKALARLGRYTTLGMMCVAALWAPAIDHFPGLFAYLQQGFAYVTSPLVAIFAVAMLSRRVTARAALAGLVTGHAVSALWFVAAQLDWLAVHFTIVAFVLLVVTLAATYLWQHLLGGAPAAAQLASVSTADVAPAPRFVRRGAAVLTLATAALVAAFW